MADNYDPFNLRKHPGYYAELVQESDPQQDVAASYVKNHARPGGILDAAQTNPQGWGESPLPFDPTGAELRSTSEGGSAFKARPQDLMHPVAEAISPTLGAFGAGQMAGTAYKEAGEGDYQEAGMSLAPLLAGMVMPGGPKGVRPKIPREIDARGFYSPSLEAAKGLGQEKGTVAQFRSMLLSQGGKPKELEAVGFDKAFPDPNAKISRQEIEQYLRDNRVQLGEKRFGKITYDAIDYMGDVIGTFATREEAQRAVAADPNGSIGGRVAETMTNDAERFESYSTPGGIPGSYREVVTTLPPPKTPELQRFNDAQARGEAASLDDYNASVDQTYTSSHWPGITNPVLHYRQKDFLNHADPTSVGSLEKVTQPKTRVLDELQSDAQQNRKKLGTRDPAAAEQLTKTLREAEAAQKQAYDEATTFIKAIDPDGMHYGQKLRWGAVPEVLDSLSGYENHAAKAKELKAKIAPLDDRVMDLQNKVSAATKGIPDLPFTHNTSDWVDLGLKQALIDAAKDPSVSRLAWAPGKVQADRYRLSQSIPAITVEPGGMGQRYVSFHEASGHPIDTVAVGPDGKIMSADGPMRDHKGKTLEELVGRDVAAGIMGATSKTKLDTSKLEIGGEGMKSFYGDMTPEGYQSGIVGTRLQKLVKGLDPEAARVEPTPVNGQIIHASGKVGVNTGKGVKWYNSEAEAQAAASYPSVSITPSMREKILKEGLPLFNIAAFSALVSRMLGQGQTEDEQ